MRIHEVKTQHDKVQQVKKFAKWAIDELGIEVQPTIKYGNDLGQVTTKRTFGSTSSNGDIWVHVGNRNVADICRTLAHELTHHRQFEQGIATNNMDDEQHLKIEDDANSRAGRMMRAYGKLDKTIYESKGK
jgi:ethanolamine utilization microcompartment shell protein EutL